MKEGPRGAARFIEGRGVHRNAGRRRCSFAAARSILALELGDVSEAIDQAKLAVGSSRSRQNYWLMGEHLILLAGALQRGGDIGEARVALAEALSVFEEKEIAPLIASTRAPRRTGPSQARDVPDRSPNHGLTRRVQLAPAISSQSLVVVDQLRIVVSL
jgi:hypothetical protein